jgi:SM-20-related protein
MEARFEELIEGFITNKIGISEAFLGLDLTGALQQNLVKLEAEHLMLKANIGNNAIKDQSQKIRGDTTSWLQADSKNLAELEFLDVIAQFISHLNRTCYTGLNACEFHYAIYEKGTFYSKHKDGFQTDNNRKYSMISYLNKDWLHADGGDLIIHQNDTEQHISPNNRKTVFFQSDVLEHEVAIAHRPRMSVTGWLKRV